MTMNCFEPLLCCGGKGNKVVAAQMGMQVIHWEKEGVMEIFKGSESEAVQRLEALIEKKPDLVSPTHPSRDNVGAALLHWSVIHRGVFQNKAAAAVVESLMESHWSDVVNVYYKEPNTPLGPFDGESALHLAVAFGDTKLIKLLLRSHADPSSRAYGTFFSPSGTNYFGEYPLSFAVACGNLEVAEILVAEGRGKQVLFNRDSFGNTALHIATIHRRKELLDWLLVKMAAEGGDMADTESAFGKHGGSGLTPLGLATVLAHKDGGAMFDFILGRMSRIEWVFGRVSCTSVPLEQLDTIPLDPSRPQHISLLNVVLCKRIYELSTHPHLVGIMEAKWTQYGSTAFFAAFVFHILRLFVITYLAVTYREVTEEIDTNTQYPNATSCGTWTNATTGEVFEIDNNLLIQLEWTVFADAVAQSFVVVLDCYAGYSEYISQRLIIREQIRRTGQVTIPPFLSKQPDGAKLWAGLLSGDNFMAFATTKVTSWLDSHVPLSEYDLFAWIGQILVITHMAAMLANSMCPSPFSTGILSISLLFIWMSSLKFTAFSRELGMLTTIVFRTIKSDVSSFMVIFSIFLIGFGTSIHVLSKGRGSYSTALDHLVKLVLGDTSEFANWDNTLEDQLSWLAYFLHLWFAICALVILLNLLISIFSCTFTSVRDMSEREWRLSKGRATLLLERRLKLLFPCMIDRMRVNHFAGDVQANHRYVFMTETEDGPPEDASVAAVREAVREVMQNEAVPAAAEEPHNLEERTFDHMAQQDQPDEMLVEKTLCDAHEILIRDRDDETDDFDRTAYKQNPLSNLGHLIARRASVTADMLEKDSLDETQQRPEGCFDNLLGKGSWEAFRSMVEADYGNLSNLYLLTEDECYQLCVTCFPNCTSPLLLTKCSESLFHHARSLK
eukprot:TRINITY_DN25000_c0_g1_i1.p1 TRINITY_DN25000_c0_g1~~TRINITY_DN25000_c0_g1_i1.p1  ORF type:complete len:897 (+),score=317.42 TRINITY_DN25000_c0_g1_i1:159-2849(+)